MPAAVFAAHASHVSRRHPAWLLGLALTQQPGDASVAVGASAHFRVVATGDPAPTLQWQMSVDGGANWTTIAGAMTASYDTAATIADDDGKQFRAVASNSIGSVSSASASLTVAGWGRNQSGQLGDNGSGELGNGTATPSATPVAVTGLDDVVAIAAATAHSCALRSNGTVACRGNN